LKNIVYYLHIEKQKEKKRQASGTEWQKYEEKRVAIVLWPGHIR